MAVPTVEKTRTATRAQERLNEKLAKAMVSRNLSKKADASETASEIPSRTASPSDPPTSPRPSSELLQEPQSSDVAKERSERKEEFKHALNGENHDEASQVLKSGASTSYAGSGASSPLLPIEVLKEDSMGQGPSTDSRGSASTRPSTELTRAIVPNSLESAGSTDSVAEPSKKSPEEYEKALEQLRADNEVAELQRQEEVHNYLEQIDALHAKLKYLTREAADMAKNASADASLGSFEHKIASRDEQIALLVEEGHKLSQTELKHMNLIKRLRAKALEDEKAVADSRQAAERHEKAAQDARERCSRAENSSKRAEESLKAFSKLEKELEVIKNEKDNQDFLIRDLQQQLSQATSAAKEAEVKANAEALEMERRHASELADELSSVRIDKELAEKQHQNELRDLKEKNEREKERARAAEIEQQGEQNILESRLEAYRARAEEASAGEGNDVQAKLLRQIETLQNQYAVASENWQGIEGSLLTRVTALEKEKDDIAKKESDVRRKARETNLKCRRMEEDLERVNSKMNDMESELSSRSTQLISLQERLNKSEAELIAARTDLKAEREIWESRQTQHVEEDRARIQGGSARTTPEAAYHHFRNESPVTRSRNRPRKSSNADRSPYSSQRQHGLAITNSGHSPMERPLSRRSSTQPVSNLHNLQTSDFQAQRPVSRHDSLSTVPQVSLNNGIPETPSLADKDEDSFGFHTPATPERTINDLISVSTAGAGPSVQLVERMSAAVRRLESEKAVHKDELNRLVAQRDESREQVVSLMKEVEEKRKWEGRVKQLEKEMKAVDERYLTTLEMLGEKSEKVEELKADVQDLKDMYRELVDSTMR